MARKQAADYEQRREVILDIAAGLFARNGYLGTSVADLAQACDTSKSLIYHYYPSKEDILFAVMSSHIEQLAAVAEAAVAASDDPGQGLVLLTRNFMRLYVGAAARHKVLLNDLNHLPPDRRAIIVAAQRQLIQTVEEILTGLHAPLGDDRTKRRAAAMLYFGMINWTHTWFRSDGALDADGFADMVVVLVRRGIGGL